MSTTRDARARTAPARTVHLRRAAERAVDDPVKLARAARIIRVALERQRLRLADLTPAADIDGSIDADGNEAGGPDAAA